MRTSRLARLLCGALLIGAAGPTLALDPPARPLVRAPAVGYASANEAMRSAAKGLSAGDTAGAVQALEYAAEQGNPLAQWKLGQLHASGDGVPHDDLKAFEYFSKIADEYADESPDSTHAPVVANAFVALGTYFLDGIKGTYVKPNAGRAHEMFHYAASYFGNANAQYSLARLYLDGTGVGRDPRQAARWFNLAAEKGHPPAQALLGQQLFNGIGVPRQRPVGLMWMMLARGAADVRKDRWIVDLHDRAVEQATEIERQRAQAHLDQKKRR